MALVFDIKVFPCAGRKGWKVDKAGSLRCYLNSPAEKGKANAELIKEIAKVVNVPLNQIAIVSGSLSRNKKIKIDLDLAYDKLLQLLGIECQMNVFSK